MTPLTPFTLLLTFLKAGGLTIGDGYATVEPIRRELTERNGWMEKETFDDCLTTVHAMPGIFNVNLATYLGRYLLGTRGSLAALFGMIFPPMVVFIVFATFYDEFCAFPAVASFLQGARPAIAALVAVPAIRMWRRSGINLSTVWMPVCAAIAVGLLGVSPSILVIGVLLIGLLYGVLVKS